MIIGNDVDNLVPLESLDLSSRTLHALRRVGIKTVAEALKMLELDKHLPQVPIPNFGKKSREELITILHAKGYIEK